MTKFTTNIITSIVGLAIVLTAAVSGAAESKIKIGYIDMQKAIQNTSAGKKAKTELESEFKKRKKDLEKKEADLKKMTDDLQKKEMVLSDDVRMKKQQELQQEMLQYRELVGKNQLEMQKKERDLTMPIVQKLHDIIGKMARKEDYTVILEKSEQSVLYADDSIDLTDRVIKTFEKESK